MIAIKRHMAPGFLSDCKKKWFKETSKAIEYYKKGTDKAFDFNAYKDKKFLKKALEGVFLKCAYCDSTYRHVYDGDIEHFRPKGRVFEKTPTTPGYYWLANDWDNLLLSCQRCNQERNDVFYCSKTNEKFGKADHFPLSDETKRATVPGQSLADEDKVRLLINPCKDDPEKHFRYDREGQIFGLTDMGRKSVEVYALHRTDLRKKREERLILINKQIGNVRKALDEVLNVSPKDDLNEKISLYEKEYAEFLTYTCDEKDYAGMARYLLQEFLEEIEII